MARSEALALLITALAAPASALADELPEILEVTVTRPGTASGSALTFAVRSSSSFPAKPAGAPPGVGP
jgi:hypothetical protein